MHTGHAGPVREGGFASCCGQSSRAGTAYRITHCSLGRLIDALS
jgi:hypothetical protein